MDVNASSENVVDPRDAAESVGLVYVSDESPGIRRRKAGKAFAYLKPDGSRLTEPAALGRIKSLAIPPAYTDVWICPKPSGHIQATGRDAKGRKQYRYHPAFREVRESTKYGHMLEFAASLPAIRKTIETHMALRGLPREKVLATIVHLLETTLIRVGNSDYAKQNRSYGLTTLRDPHVKVNGGELRFQFKGKSNKTWQLSVRNRRVAKIVKACQDLPGQDLFQYLDENGAAAGGDLLRHQCLPQGNHRTRDHREGFSHLGGHGACRDCALRVRKLRQRGEGQKECPGSDRTGRGEARQHADDLPQMLRPSGTPHLLSRRRRACRGPRGGAGRTCR